jgi:ATP-dependent helicase HrpB
MTLSNVLPIQAIKSEFCQSLTDHNTIILSAPPGAGKSTCLPLWLLSLPALANKKIYLLQPRRLAVKNIAQFLAFQLDEKVGDTIGYRLRNETNVSKYTRLEVMTEGVLTQIIQSDPELSHVALIIFDEFHERSLQGDLAFSLTREVQTVFRSDLKLLLMSATLDIDYLCEALPEAKLLQSEGRSFPVELNYLAPKNSYRWREHALTVISDKMLHHQGSILVFVAGMSDIHFLLERLRIITPEQVNLCALFGELSLREQQQAIVIPSPGQRKVVLATNIAETSLTIEGVNLVIDCGFEKVAVFDHASLMNKLIQQQISKASAVQRAGRAGRLMPGQCIRLFAKEDFERRPLHSVNDIQQADLLPMLIEAARWGVTSLSQLPLLELPRPIKEQQAWQELQNLLIIDKNLALTQHGNQVSMLACHPRLAHMILIAQTYDQNTIMLACLIAALLEERDIFKSEQAKFDCNLTHRLQLLVNSQSKHYPLYNRILKQASRLAQQVRIRLTLTTLDLSQTGLLLAHAFPERVAKARGHYGEYLCVNGKGVCVREQDSLANEDYLVVAQTQQGQSQIHVKLACYISLTDIHHIFSDQINDKQVAQFDAQSGRLIVQKQTMLGSLMLAQEPLAQTLDAESISTMWCDVISKKGLAFLSWQDKERRLIARWRWLNKYFPEYQIPLIDDTQMLITLGTWLAPFIGHCKTKNQLDKVDLSSALLSLLSFQQQKLLNQAAPNVYIGPTGRHCPISYSLQVSPKVSLPMQEVYGLTTTPNVGAVHGLTQQQGVPLLLELLSPAQRPIQVTQDLVTFWSGSYKIVQKDMKSRYPRHYWPDDPANAKATNKTKRHIKTNSS